MRRTWRISPSPELVAKLRHEVDAFAAAAGLPEPLRNDVKLAVSEAVTNALLHGYRDGRTGSIAVTAELEAGDLVLRVADDGVGMAANHSGNGGGMGLPIVKAVATSVRIDSTPQGGTELQIRFALNAA